MSIIFACPAARFPCRRSVVTAALELHGVRCVRGERLLFDRVSAVVAPGRLLRVDGANGSGKTSLLRMICGLAAPAAGQILWRSRRLAERRDDPGAGLVYLGHAAALKEELSAAENLGAACALAGRAGVASEVQAALGSAGLRGREHLPVRALSQGQRKRAALARLALSAAAGLWVLDEPYTALDDAARSWLQGLIEAQLGRGGVVVLTSHERSAWDAGVPQVVVRLESPALAEAAG